MIKSTFYLIAFAKFYLIFLGEFVLVIVVTGIADEFGDLFGLFDRLEESYWSLDLGDLNWMVFFAHWFLVLELLG